MFRSIRPILMLFAICAVAALLAGGIVSAAARNTSGSPLPPLQYQSGSVTNSGPASGPASLAANTCAPVSMSAAEADDQSLEVDGTVAQVDTTQAMLTMTVGQGCVTVSVPANVEYKDGLTSLASVHQGMTLSIEGTRQADGSVAATEIKGSTDTPDAPDTPDTPDNNGGQ
ncbi:MAG: hypothetical protein OJF49_001029 [Ktedonobacterales bacterium]|jgi:hypothetical protein|nr:MAG: hypothetical protein OJF49_001029 [Ktedonobacterales bacterium]